ncbi:hypothetical protein [Streptomyces monomycini]|uniref:hypothetical protein n=1 Tax=Streptomyces monomycini TaxID=371720 RepID=UPI0004AB107E|nr:hypothetical protein [Streptomyces monomycini]
MSLSVDVFMVGADGKRDVLDVPPGASDLAGFESWRRTVWGSPAVRSLGARFLPRLLDDDCRVQPQEVAEFTEECLLLRDHLETVARAVLEAEGSAPSTTYEALLLGLGQRLDNIIDAARRAREAGGGVIIW